MRNIQTGLGYVGDGKLVENLEGKIEFPWQSKLQQMTLSGRLIFLVLWAPVAPMKYEKKHL